MTSAVAVRALRAELVKVRSMRSIRAAIGLFVLISLGVGMLEGWSVRGAIDSNSPLLRPDFSPAQAGFDGVLYGQLAVIVLGVLMMSMEHGSGMLQLSLLAFPSRAGFFFGKVAVAAVTITVVAVPTVLLSYLATQWALGSHGQPITTTGVLRAAVGAVLYLLLMCLLALGIAAVARNAIAPLAVLLPLVLAGSQILSVIGATATVAKYLPDQAGMQLLAVHASPEKLSTTTGCLVLVGWVAVSLGSSLLLLHRRDA